MRGSQLTIALERPDPVFRPGETIRGCIRVRTAEDCRCAQLRLRCEWRTQGKGNPQTGEHRTLDLGAAEWQAGKVHEHPFELPAPSGPLTYHGHVLQVDWHLCARADVPWGLDPKAQREFELRPWTADDMVAQTGGYRDGALRVSEAYSFGPLVHVGHVMPAPPKPGDPRVGFGCLGLGVLGVLLTAWLGAASLIIGALLALTGGAVLLMERSRGSVHRMLGRPRATLTPNQASPGETVEVSVELAPPSPLTVSASAELHGIEVVENGAGSSRSTHEHELAHQVVELAPNHTVLEGPRVLTATFVVPEDAPVTFAAQDNEVRWMVHARISSEAAADWFASLPLTVRPPAARALPQAAQRSD